jgi:hypothetical protein
MGSTSPIYVFFITLNDHLDIRQVLLAQILRAAFPMAELAQLLMELEQLRIKLEQFRIELEQLLRMSLSWSSSHSADG